MREPRNDSKARYYLDGGPFQRKGSVRRSLSFSVTGGCALATFSGRENIYERDAGARVACTYKWMRVGMLEAVLLSWDVRARCCERFRVIRSTGSLCSCSVGAVIGRANDETDVVKSCVNNHKHSRNPSPSIIPHFPSHCPLAYFLPPLQPVTVTFSARITA